MPAAEGDDDPKRGDGDGDAVVDAIAALHRLLEPGLVRLPYAERLTELLSRAMEICGSDAATVLLVDPETSELVAAASVGHDDDAARRIPIGTDLAGRAAERRAIVVVEDPDALVELSPPLAERGISAAAAVPMIVGGDVVGVLVVGSKSARVFEQVEVTALDLAADRLALAVEHHRVTEQAQSATADMAMRYRSLHTLAAALAGAVTPRDVIQAGLRHGLLALNADNGSIALLDGTTLRIAATSMPPEIMDEWRSFPLDANIPMAQCIREDRPVFTSTQRELAAAYPEVGEFTGGADRAGATASLTLCAAGAPLGSIGLIFGTDREFTEVDRELLETVAQQLAQALARAQLYEAEHEATSRLRFLAQASGLLLSSLDYETTLRTLADLVVPEMADWCAIDMVASEGTVRRLAVAHVDPDKVALAQDIHDRYPFDPDAPTGVANVLRTGELEHMPEITDEILAAVVPDRELRATLRQLQLRCAVVAPLKARGRVLGVMTFVMAESGRTYAADEIAVIQELTRLAGVAVDNAQLFYDRSEVARALQASLLPPVLPRIPRLEVAARYLPSGSQAEVGGDFYDVFRDVGGQWALVIGDVCGKGPEAAGVTGLARHTIRAMAQHDPAPGTVLEAVNVALLDQVPVGRFCTIGYARFDTTGPEVSVTVASGGHPLALVRRPSGLVEAVGRPGMLVGVTRPAVCPEDVAVLGPGDALLLYTDGLVERHKAAGGVEDGEPALRAVFSRCDGLDADAIADLILSVSFDQPDSARDDVALLVVRVVE